MLRATNLNAYYGEFHVLENVSIEVLKGQVVVMLGPNGHGKSTLLKAICGLAEKVEGKIIYNEKEITVQPAEKLVNQGITYISENRELFPQMTVMENLKLGAYSKNARPHERKNLKKVFRLFPRLKERKRQLASTLSGGEARMLALARGLMSNANFLCVDEPCLGLQPNLRMEVLRIIKEINQQGITILLVEQNIPKITELADQLYVLEEGQVTFQGNKDQALGNTQLKDIFLGM
ncbi:MAG: ABC transporter ATP-binding protein [Desulfobacteraceae bacterium]|nr:ABC transporter ATP-binding protein [Desulfobacteraceae bacterium]